MKVNVGVVQETVGVLIGLSVAAFLGYPTYLILSAEFPHDIASLLSLVCLWAYLDMMLTAIIDPNGEKIDQKIASLCSGIRWVETDE